MFTLDLDKLTPEQRAMVALWEEHMKAEFQDKDARASCDTMVANPYVNHVPVLTGGVGRRQLLNYYSPGAIRAAGPSRASGGWGRGRPQGPRSGGRAVEPLDEADDQRRVAVTRRTLPHELSFGAGIDA